MSEQTTTKPESQQLPPEYELSVSDPKETGVRLFNVKSSETDITAVFVEFNDGYDVHAAIPWAGARTSRSDDPHEGIYAEIRDVTHSEKIDMFFGYGHQSIANMSPLMVHLNNLPMSEAYWIFNHLVLVGGQETSTRYVELKNPTVTALESLVDISGLEDARRQQLVTDWEVLQRQAHDGFAKWFPIIKDGLMDFVRKEHPDAKEGAMDKRALDAARAWIPFGGRTSMSLQFDVREAISLITQLDQRQDFYGQRLADQLTTLLSLKRYEGSEDIQADLAGLLKYAKGSDTISKNTERLKESLDQTPEFSRLKELSLSRLQTTPSPQETSVELIEANAAIRPGNEVVAGYIMTILPNIGFDEALGFVNQLPEVEQADLLRTIFNDHTHHNILRNAADIRGHVMDIDTALAYQRDFNRHRAMGRLATMLETDNHDAVIRTGFNRSHVISRTSSLRSVEDEWNQDMVDLYDNIYRFYEDIKTVLGPDQDYGFMQHVLPLGHQSRLLMSGPLMQWDYLTHLRIRPGGDYGYRDATFDMAETLADSTYTQRKKGLAVKPNYDNTSELLDRS